MNKPGTMQEEYISLYNGAYTSNPKTEQRTDLLAAFLVLIQLTLLLYLVLTKGFAYSFVGLYLLHLLAFLFLVGQVWLERNPQLQWHLTFTGAGVSYRTGLLQKEHNFDWDEVDEVYLTPRAVEFILKNEERHLVPFTRLHDAATLRRARHEIQTTVQQKGISLTYSQK